MSGGVCPRGKCSDPDETWRVYSIGCGTKLLGSGILNFGPCAPLGHTELSAVGRDEVTHSDRC